FKKLSATAPSAQVAPGAACGFFFRGHLLFLISVMKRHCSGLAILAAALLFVAAAPAGPQTPSRTIGGGTLAVLDAGQWQLKGADARTFAEKSGALAAINANYFDEKGRPLAYLKTAAQEINRAVSKHALYTGVFGVGDGGPFVLH